MNIATWGSVPGTWLGVQSWFLFKVKVFVQEKENSL